MLLSISSSYPIGMIETGWVGNSFSNTLNKVGSLVNTNIRATVSVCVALLAAFIGTGFVSSAYQRERGKLGDRHFRAGQALMRVDDLGGAAEEFRKALLFAPDNREYRLSLATALVDGGRLEEAESHLEQLSEEDPTNGRINLLLAQVAMRQHHEQEALESYQRAVYEYWPPDQLYRRRQARWELIDLLEETGKHRDQLVGELLQLYGNLPPHSDQRMKVGTMLLGAGADAEAAHVFKDVLKDAASEPSGQAAKDLVGAYSGLARIAFRAGDFVEARHDYQHALHVAPDDLATAAQLQFTNEIVDISPQLPNISPRERLRRSQNLLNRIESDLQLCAGTDTEKATLEARLQDLNKPAKKSADEDDAAALLQQTAQALWKDRTTFCGANHVNDPAVDAVLPRLGQS